MEVDHTYEITCCVRGGMVGYAFQLLWKGYGMGWAVNRSVDERQFAGLLWCGGGAAAFHTFSAVIY